MRESILRIQEIFFFTATHNNTKNCCYYYWWRFYKRMQRENSFEPWAEFLPWLLSHSGSSLLGRDNNSLHSPSVPALRVTSWCLDLTQENTLDLDTAVSLLPGYTLAKWFLERTPILLNWITWIISQYFWVLAQPMSWSWILFALTPLCPPVIVIVGVAKLRLNAPENTVMN